MLPTNKAEKLATGMLGTNSGLSSVTRTIVRNRSLLNNLRKNFLLKPAFKLFKNRRGYPAFWTMPYDPICREILFNGYYEKELLMGMCKLVENKSGTVLDIGANIGNHTVFFSREFENVISFEPTPSNCWAVSSTKCKKCSVMLPKIKCVWREQLRRTFEHERFAWTSVQFPRNRIQLFL